MAHALLHALAETIAIIQINPLRSFFSIGTMDNIGDISGKILAYLKRHPDSADTIEGIARWWLELDEIDHAVDTVSEALELLLAEGKVQELEFGKGKRLYKLVNNA